MGKSNFTYINAKGISANGTPAVPAGEPVTNMDDIDVSGGILVNGAAVYGSAPADKSVATGFGWLSTTALRLNGTVVAGTGGGGGGGSARLMIVSDRFGVPTDVGTSDQLLQPNNWLGGNGTVSIGDFFYRRWKFSTGAWAPKKVRAWNAQVALYPAGVVDIQASYTLERDEIRRASDGSLVFAILYGSNPGRVYGPGETSMSDAGGDLDPNTEYYFDRCWTGGRGSGWGTQGGSVAVLPGERSRSGTTTFSASAPPTSGGPSSSLGPNNAPIALVGEGWDGTSPVLLVVGDSRADQTNIIPSTQTKTIGYVADALSSASGGVITYMHCPRYSSGLASLDNPQAVTGSTSMGLLDWLGTKWLQLTGQAAPPWQAIYSEHGFNSLNDGASGPGMINRYSASKTRARQYWPGIPWIQETIAPNPIMASGTFGNFTTEANQIGAITATKIAASGGWIEDTNTRIVAGGGGVIDLAIDTAVTLRSTTNYAATKAEGFVANIVGALATNTSSTVVMTAAPPIGAMLTFEPGVSGNEDSGYQVISVSANGSNFNVNLTGTGRVPTSAKKVALAHADGTEVRGSYFTTETGGVGGVHQSQEASGLLRDAIIPRKAAIAALCRTYKP
jgi:hypothetical protein